MGDLLLTAERDTGSDPSRVRRRHARAPHPLLGLQGKAGNAAVARLVQAQSVQRSCGCGGKCGCTSGALHQGTEEPELVGQLGVQRSCACGGKCDDCNQGALGSGDEQEELKGELHVQRAAAKKVEAPTLRKGSRSPFVLELQRQLVAYGIKVKGDGKFGRGTMKAVKEFQRANGLKPDGVVGRQTWHALEGGGAGPTDAQGPPPDHALVLAKLKTAHELVKGLNKPKPGSTPGASPQTQPAAADTAGIGFLDDEIDAAEQAVGDVASEVETGVENTVNAVEGAVEGAVDSVVETASDAAEAVGGAVEAAGDWAAKTASDVGGYVGEKAAEAGEWVENEVVKPAEQVVQAVGDKVGEIGGEIAAVADDVKKQFGAAFDDLSKAMEEIGKELSADWDAVVKWLDSFLGGVGAAAAANVNAAGTDPAAASGLPAGCNITVEAVAKGRDQCPIPEGGVDGPDELDKAMGKKGRGAGALMTYSYPRLNMGTGYCPISLDGGKLTETVTSDGAVSGKSGVRTGTCPINVDGTIADCNDTYGICLPAEDVIKNMGGRSTATETFTQQLFVQGTLVETHQIKFRFWREGPVVTVTDITRE